MGELELSAPVKVPEEALEGLLERYISGEPIAHIAAGLGVRKQSLHERLVKRFGPLPQQLKEQHWETRLDEGLDELKRFLDAPDLARTREAWLKRLEWRASVECPDRWGQRENRAPTAQVAVQIVLNRGEKDTDAAQQSAIIGAEVVDESEDIDK